MFSLVNYTNVMLLGSYFIGVTDLRFHKYTVALASVLILFSCKKKCKMFFLNLVDMLFLWFGLKLH